MQQAYIPPHERTQEIDIDAMLELGDSREETETEETDSLNSPRNHQQKEYGQNDVRDYHQQEAGGVILYFSSY